VSDSSDSTSDATWKTGNPQNTDPARDNAQLAFGALCVHLYHGVQVVEVQLRFPDRDPDRHVLDAFDLLEIRDRIDGTIEEMIDPDTVIGMHCTSKWCPLRATCPRTVEALAEICPDDAMTIVQDVQGITSSEHCGHMYHRHAAAKALLDRVETAIKAYVDEHGPVPLGDGTEYGPAEESRDSIVADTPQDIFEALDGALEAEQFASLIRVSVPKTGLEKAIKATVEKGKGAAWTIAMDKLRSANMVRTKTITTHRVRKIKS
jgi:hypothetical protein